MSWIKRFIRIHWRAVGENSMPRKRSFFISPDARDLKERDSRMDNGANDGANDGESAAFAMDDTDEEFCVTAKGRAVAAARTTAATAKTKSTAAPRGKGKASSKATKVTKVTKATKATKVSCYMGEIGNGEW